MEKLDLTKKFKTYYTAKPEPQLVDIERARFVSIVGKGDPSGTPFLQRIEALYSTVYGIKFDFKARDKDFVVSKLEGFWWFDEVKYADKTIENSSTDVPRSEWEYRLAIRLPEYVTMSDIAKAKEAAFARKGAGIINEVEFFEVREGKCVQMLHVGPYSKEIDSLKVIGKFCDERGLKRNGHHHEIYLSDFRKTAPDRLKTILREPVN